MRGKEQLHDESCTEADRYGLPRRCGVGLRGPSGIRPGQLDVVNCGHGERQLGWHRAGRRCHGDGYQDRDDVHGCDHVECAFTIPAVPSGTYTLNVALQGFKTAVLKDVVVTVGQPATVRAGLQPGGGEETVTVGTSSEIVQTQSTAAAQTLSARQMANLPVPGPAAFDLVSYLPGVSSPHATIA